MGVGSGLARGIDVSKWQAATPPLDGLDFLIARASIGLTPDERYDQHIAKAKAAGLVTGAYHFNWDSIPAREQAQYFVRLAGDVDLLFIDVEGTMAFSHAQTADFIDEVHRLGRKCGLYHSASGYFDAGQDYDWIAKWSPTPPSRRWDLWQEGSTVLGGKRIDHNYFRGSPAELRAFVEEPAPMKITPSPGLVYSEIAVPKVGVPMFTGPGTGRIRDTRAGDRFPKVAEADDAPGGWHLVRVPGGTVAWIARGNLVAVEPIPPVAPDCTDAVVRYKAALDARTTALRAISVQAMEAAESPPAP